MNINKTLFQFIKILFSIMVIMLLIYAAIGMSSLGYDFGYRVFTEPAMEEAPGRYVLIQVEEKTSAKDLGETMERKGLIRDARLFWLQLRLSSYYGKLVPGVYELNTSMTPKEMIVVMGTKPPEDTTNPSTEEDVEPTEPESSEGASAEEEFVGE